MELSFDIISDLYLDEHSDFNWQDKPTSLFCIVPGNITSDLTTLCKVFLQLKKVYQGVFFIDGTLENNLYDNKDTRIKELNKICSSIPNVIYLHSNVVIVEGVALVGINGWQPDMGVPDEIELFQNKLARYDDIYYLDKTIEKLQLHNDVKKIVIISNSVPSKDLYYGELPDFIDELFPVNALGNDTENKVVKWIYGTSDKLVDTIINGVNFVNNPKVDRNPYYPKRITVEV